MKDIEEYTDEDLAGMDKEEIIDLILKLQQRRDELQAEVDKNKKHLENLKALQMFLTNPSAIKEKSKLKAPLRDP